MIRPVQLLTLMIAGASLVAGCAPPKYTPRYVGHPAPQPDVVAMPLRATEGGVMVAADPYLERGRQEAIFDADLNASRALAVQVIVANHGSHRLLVPSSDLRGEDVISLDITLRLPDRREIVPVGPSALALYLEKMPIFAKPMVVPPPVVDPRVYTLAILAQVVAGGASSAGMGFQVESDLDARRTDYRNKALPEVALAPGESANGFVYFILPPDARSVTGSVLTIPVVDRDEGRTIRISLTLN